MSDAKRQATITLSCGAITVRARIDDSSEASHAASLRSTAAWLREQASETERWADAEHATATNEESA